MVARIRSRLSSIARYGSLSPAVLCMLYSAFVLPLYDYCDVVWSPTTARLNRLVERVYSKFIKRLPLSYHLRLSFTLTERHRYHTALQVFKSLCQIYPPYLHNIFHFLKDLSGHISRNLNRLLPPEFLPILEREVSLSRGCVVELFTITSF